MKNKLSSNRRIADAVHKRFPKVDVYICRIYGSHGPQYLSVSCDHGEGVRVLKFLLKNYKERMKSYQAEITDSYSQVNFYFKR